jgi:hypothetical protein
MSDKQVCLDGKQLEQISQAMGGRRLTNGDEIVGAVLEALTIGVDNALVQLDPEDAHALKEHCEEFSYSTYDEYVAETVREALHMFLWGSTRGTLAYR